MNEGGTWGLSDSMFVFFSVLSVAIKAWRTVYSNLISSEVAMYIIYMSEILRNLPRGISIGRRHNCTTVKPNHVIHIYV